MGQLIDELARDLENLLKKHNEEANKELAEHKAIIEEISADIKRRLK